MITPSKSAVIMYSESMWHVNFKSGTTRLIKKNMKIFKPNSLRYCYLYTLRLDITNSILNKTTYIFSSVLIFYSWATISDEFVTSLMDNADTYLALVALFTQPPNEITTMRAKCRLPQERCHKFVCIDLVNSSFHGTSPLFHGKSSLLFFELSHRLGLFFLGGPL